MEKCSWTFCDSPVSSIYPYNIPSIVVYSCGVHVSHTCSLCNSAAAGESPIDKLEIGWHLMIQHTLKTTARNYLSCLYDQPILINFNYYKYGLIDGYRFCYLTNIIKTHPHFTVLVPEFSISDILDQFDEGEVPSWRLLSTVLNKSFSCLFCHGVFESFPSNEVFNAHPCKS